MKKNWSKTILLLICLSASFMVSAQNPVIQTIYTADPAPMVYKDTVFLYTGHDEDHSNWFTMKDWHVFSTTDMVNWTDRGSPLSLQNFKWAQKDAWAGQCIYRNGKFYWYVPINAKGVGMSIGVAISDNPTGPFIDAIGKPMIHSGNGDIDPTVFIDTDGQAYLYWGNPYLKYVKLNKDMVSYSGDIITVPLNKEGFNIRIKDADKRPSAYEEGPWLDKRGNLYYLLYPAGGVPEHLAYSTSTSATGPWKYQDTIMKVIKNNGAFTNHPGMISYKGKSYLFYHNAGLPGGGGFNRSVCIEEFKFKPDGTIPRITPTTGVLSGVGNLNPFKRVEAETIAWEDGVKTAANRQASNGIIVTDIINGDYIKVRNVSFNKRAKSFQASISPVNGGLIEVHLDSLSGKLLSTCRVQRSVGEPTWATISSKVNHVSGQHDMFLVFKGEKGELYKFDWWQFTAD